MSLVQGLKEKQLLYREQKQSQYRELSSNERPSRKLRPSDGVAYKQQHPQSQKQPLGYRSISESIVPSQMPSRWDQRDSQSSGGSVRLASMNVQSSARIHDPSAPPVLQSDTRGFQPKYPS